MSLDFLKTLKETMKNIDDLNRDKFNELYQEAAIYFQTLLEKADSDGEEVLTSLYQLKDYLGELSKQFPAQENLNTDISEFFSPKISINNNKPKKLKQKMS